ncbi:MAG: type II methionyl aminopeptidase [Archaeoglobaceae archaeon]
MKDEEVEKLLEAGRILKKVVEEAVEKVKPGVKILDVAEFVEKRIVELGAKPAFPCNLSIDSDAAHFTPKAGDERVFEEGSLVKLDVGVHVDGYIADMAVSVDLGDHREMIRAAKEACEAAVESVKAGTTTAELGKIIEETIRSYGYKPVVNLTGHGLLPYVVHAPPTVPNHSAAKGVELREGMVIAIEPFATDGVGRVAERGECEIYSLIAAKPVRMKPARQLIEKVLSEYRTLPFARRWINAPDIIVARLVREGVFRAYPVLSEVSGGKVSQWEHTVIVEEGGCTVTTK